MRLAEEARQYSDGEQQQQPRTVCDERSAERDERDEILAHREENGEKRNPPDGLSARPLEMIVKRRILELREIERRCVLHQLDAHVVRKQIAEQTLHQRRSAGEDLAREHDDYFQNEISPDRSQRAVPGTCRD